MDMNRVQPLLGAVRLARSVGCTEDHQCPTGFFCEVPQLSCRPCLRCEHLNRHPRQNITSCITSVAACGGCFAGLVPSQGDNKCLSPDEGQQLLLPYEWAVIAISLLLAVIICAAAVYVLRNFDTFKIFASTRTSVHSSVDVEASAPQLPPSYSDVSAAASLTRNDNEKTAFISPIPTPPADETHESVGHQTARVFNNPSYVRTFHPPSYDETPDVQGPLPIIQETSEDSLSRANTMMAAVEETSANEPKLDQKPHQARQDSNNNRGREDKRDCSFTHGGTAFVINVIKNVNTVQQQNDLIL